MASQQSNITSTSTVTSNPRTHDTTKKYHFNWHDNIKCQSHCIYNSTCAFRCCPEMCRYYSRSNSNSQGSKINLLARPSKKNDEGNIQGICKSPSVGIPTTQSSIDGATTRGIYPSFVIHPNYHNGQIHYPPNPISHPPTTFSYYNYNYCKNDIYPKDIHCKNLICHSNNTTTASYPNTIPSPARRNTQTTYCVCSNVFGGIPHPKQTFFLWLI